MVRTLSLWIAAAVLAMGVSGADLDDVKTVYLLSMPNGLDQFLAIRLTHGALFQVVTDPLKADAVFTDRIGAGFEETLDTMYGDKKSKDAKDKDKAGNDVPQHTMSPLSRGKGAIFLVDRKTRNVIWSDYELPKNAQPSELNHVADKIAGKLEKDKKGK